MDTLEVLTLVLVIFAALSYIDDHNKKKWHPYPEKVRCYFNTFYTTEGKSESHPIHFLSRLYNGVLEKSSTLFNLTILFLCVPCPLPFQKFYL